ncbi:preprotein translocase subunit YajC [Corynebacterium sp. ES2794-CONJ1]|uniref:preprotein translocase subunit YajC n=1 Tax=unclassified Corynebacterium TaxID=2624378 RepID=UPI002169E842|nr:MULTISPECIES: preprotein translocase subunit YajC [unclassified Corynebacterium]MCS4489226.1 preprotein translocase subunit YajC [Corynebacterium sp. ES2775-CONJ]MCS4491039.1 preprotein translocase subunit YajC [Corynebacterium sp. ES2715-CONJ3]MCS4531080.1 preprotein translocase subunit YajC [Corynebacterium sp. ES2730-CONJ]MCU9518447.1 preprotein translocase subunit YajC [Corynebacterium sp. ES2794-CONJ1]
MDSIFLLILILAVVFVPSFLMQRKQRRKIQEIHELQEALMINDQVLTTAGLHGTVVGIAEATVELETSPGVVSTWEKAVVVRNLTQEQRTLPDHEDA